MRRVFFFSIGLFFLIGLSSSIYAQYPPREDVWWARQTTETITLDGVLNEASWAAAEELQIVYGESAGLPFSGWQADPSGGNGTPTDITDATVKVLVSPDNYLYVAFDVPDTYILGSTNWANWEGVLISIKSRKTPAYLTDGAPTGPVEYFYCFWYPDTTYLKPGTGPVFRGPFGGNDTIPGFPDYFDGAMVIDGVSNDSLPDVKWVAELKINLDTLGYDVTKPEGEVIEFNFSIWDKDAFPGDPLASYTTRTWWQSPWNANDWNVGRLHTRPDITTTSGPVPVITEPDVVIPNGANYPDPVIDGNLDEEVWIGAYSFDIAWENMTLRESYPGVGKYRSGRFQPQVAGGQAAVVDPVVAHIKVFFKDNFLYFGADIEDQLVQGAVPSQLENQMDGVVLRIGDRDSVGNTNTLTFKELGIYIDTAGTPTEWLALSDLMQNSNSEWALYFKPGTVLHNFSSPDDGYSVEMKVDLSYFGYPEVGDDLLFFSVKVADADSIEQTGGSSSDNYATRTWWFGEKTQWATPWAVMDSDMLVGVDGDVNLLFPSTIEIYGNYPNPFNPVTTLKYSVPSSGNVTISIYNIIGQKVSEHELIQNAGNHEFRFNAESLSSGVYFYKVHLKSNNGKSFESKAGKMILMK
jgi:hypothetical protein